MITFAQETVLAFKTQAQELLQAHWEEVALNKDAIPLDPDWELYYDLEESGALKGFVARDDDVMIGYFVVICRSHIHYKSTVFAFNDIIYLSPEYRKTSVAPRLIEFAERYLREDGVRVMVVNTKTSHPFDSLLVRSGYSHTENIYTKLLE